MSGLSSYISRDALPVCLLACRGGWLTKGAGVEQGMAPSGGKMTNGDRPQLSTFRLSAPFLVTRPIKISYCSVTNPGPTTISYCSVAIAQSPHAGLTLLKKSVTPQLPTLQSPYLGFFPQNQDQSPEIILPKMLPRPRLSSRDPPTLEAATMRSARRDRGRLCR